MRSSILFLAILFGFTLKSQITISPELAIKLDGKDNFKEVWQTVFDHYESMNLDSNKTAFREFKKWNRWAWWAVRNIDGSGKIINNDNALARSYNIIQNEYKAANRSNTGSWSPLSTNSFSYSTGNIVGTGRVDRIIFHPSNPNLLYVASSGGGLWKSDNQGSNWYCLTNYLPNCGVTGVAIDESDPSGNTIFIATGDGDTGPGGYFVTNYQFRKNSFGILKTVDGGTTWTLMGNSQNQMGTRRPYKLIKLKGFADRFLCATTSGIMMTSNNGMTWNIIGSGPHFDIEQDPDDNNVVFISNNFGMIKSIDGGLTFNAVSNSSFSPAISSSSTRSAIAYNISNSNELYFMQIDASTNEILYKSSDGGLTFTAVSSSSDICDGCDVYMGPLAANSNFVITGGVNLFRSTNGGSSFTDNTNWFANSTTSPQFIHADIHDLAYNPSNNKLYGATDGGVFLSNDNGNTWSHISSGLNTLQFYHLDGLDGAANTFTGGFQDNGSALTVNSGSNLNFYGKGDGYQAKFVPTSSNIIYYVCNKFVAKYNSTTNVSTDLTGDISWFPKIACHPTNSQIAYFGFASNIYKTTNQGTNLTVTANFGASNNASSHAGGLATTEAAPDYLYAANASTVRRSTDQGVNWTVISGSSGWATNFSAITDISACNSNQNILYVATNSSTTAKVLFTQDAGSTWINITGTLPQEAIVFSVACHNNGDAYIGTNMGVFYQGITMSDWIPYLNGMPLVEVTDLFINEASNKITVSTFGRGMWQSDLYNACQSYEYLSGIIYGTNRYQTSDVIESTHEMNASYDNNLAYKADTRIRLLPGFNIKEGAYFHGQIAPCGEGVFNVKSKKIVPANN